MAFLERGNISVSGGGAVSMGAILLFAIVWGLAEWEMSLELTGRWWDG